MNTLHALHAWHETRLGKLMTWLLLLLEGMHLVVDWGLAKVAWNVVLHSLIDLVPDGGGKTGAGLALVRVWVVVDQTH